MLSLSACGESVSYTAYQDGLGPQQGASMAPGKGDTPAPNPNEPPIDEPVVDEPVVDEPIADDHGTGGDDPLNNTPGMDSSEVIDGGIYAHSNQIYVIDPVQESIFLDEAEVGRGLALGAVRFTYTAPIESVVIYLDGELTGAIYSRIGGATGSWELAPSETPIYISFGAPVTEFDLYVESTQGLTGLSVLIDNFAPGG